MHLQTFLKKHHDGFLSLCQQHQVRKIYAFGSSITDRFDQAKSDIDLLVDVDIADPVCRGESLLSLWDQLELFFGRKVDLLTEDSLRNPYLKASIERTRKLIYDRDGEKILI